MKEKCRLKQKTQYGATPGMKELSGQGEFRKTAGRWAGYVEGSPHLAPDSIVHCNSHQEILSLHLKEDVYKADFFFLVLWRHGITLTYRLFKQKDR